MHNNKNNHNIVETVKVGFYVYSLRVITSLAQGHIHTNGAHSPMLTKYFLIVSVLQAFKSTGR